jgi:hypothetical protein
VLLEGLILLQARKEWIGESNMYKGGSCLKKCMNKQRSFSCILTLVGFSNFLSYSIFASRVLERDLVLSTLVVELESSSSSSTFTSLTLSLLNKEGVEELLREE